MSEIKERIIDHTTRMFTRDGLRSVRMDDIATEMGISKRTIYEIFGDKEALIMECLDYFHHKIKAHNDDLTRDADNIIAEYLIVLDVWDKQMEAAGRIMDDVMKFYPQLYERFRAEHACAATDEFRKKMQLGIRQGYLVPTLDIDMAMIIFLHTMYGAIKTKPLAPSTAVMQREAFKFFTTHFIRGISTLKGIALIDDYFEKKLK
jgi:AcrR family transcriptional regulator